MVYIIVKLETITFDLDPPPPPPKKSCFPLIGKVWTEKGKSVQISELQIGNKVQAGKIINYLYFNLFKILILF